jgi:dihydroorotate dehydrogenase (NAD+) catalytic subunit
MVVSLIGQVVENSVLGRDVHRLEFAWNGETNGKTNGEKPGAGQFFMIKPVRAEVFLGRPVSVFGVDPLEFVIARKGAGTEAICAMRAGDEAELIGPLGNMFADFLPEKTTSPVALVGGGIGVAPLHAFAGELARAGLRYAFFAGFKTGEAAFLQDADGFTVVTEDGSLGVKGLVTDVFDPAWYAAVFVCGPLPMLEAVYRKCAAHSVPCFVSMEKRMACGVGACLGCRIGTVGTTGTIGVNRGGKRCCKDGPIFDGRTIAW